MRYSLAVLAIAAVVEASPFPQGVTQSIAPTGTAPAGCQPTYSGTFGIAVMNITAGGQQAVSQAPDGQPGASTGAGAVSTIADGQPQAPTSGGGRVVSTIADGQPQAPTKTMAPITQISDGQIQATKVTMAPVNQIGDGQVQQQKTTMAPVNQIGDGQIQQQKPTTSAVNQISDGQIQQPKPTTSAANQISDGQVQQPKPTTSAVGQISDGQPQASTSGVGTMPDGQPTAGAGGSGGSGGTSYVSCKQSDTLQITLQNGVLKDNQGRTGYIASNYQFQFDGPPQAGAIYTAGFSVCNNGSLALGGSNTFYQCLSGDFYNLYDRSWAPQCSPINIQVVELVNC